MKKNTKKLIKITLLVVFCLQIVLSGVSCSKKIKQKVRYSSCTNDYSIITSLDNNFGYKEYFDVVFTKNAGSIDSIKKNEYEKAKRIIELLEKHNKSR